MGHAVSSTNATQDIARTRKKSGYSEQVMRSWITMVSSYQEHRWTGKHIWAGTIVVLHGCYRSIFRIVVIRSSAAIQKRVEEVLDG